MLTKAEIKKLAELIMSDGEIEFCFQMSEDFEVLYELEGARISDEVQATIDKIKAMDESTRELIFKLVDSEINRRYENKHNTRRN